MLSLLAEKERSGGGGADTREDGKGAVGAQAAGGSCRGRKERVMEGLLGSFSDFCW